DRLRGERRNEANLARRPVEPCTVCWCRRSLDLKRRRLHMLQERMRPHVTTYATPAVPVECGASSLRQRRGARHHCYGYTGCFSHGPSLLSDWTERQLSWSTGTGVVCLGRPLQCMLHYSLPRASGRGPGRARRCPTEYGEAFGRQVGVRIDEGKQRGAVCALDVPGDPFDAGPQLSGAGQRLMQQ